MANPIFHSAYTAEQIENEITNGVPRINSTTKHWERWDIATGAWVDTGITADSETAATAAEDARDAAITAQGKAEDAQGYAEAAQTAAEAAAAHLTIDSALSLTSEQPVQNKVITQAVLNAFPHAEASGAVASFNDGADNIPARSCAVTLGDVTGRDSIKVVRAGRNYLKNVFESRTVTGVTFTVNEDGSVNIKNANTGANSVYTPAVGATALFGEAIPVPAGNYLLKRSGVSGVYVWIRRYDASGAEIASVAGSVNSDTSVTIGAGEYVAARVYVQTTYSGAEVTIYPALYLATDAPSEWEPYVGAEYTVPLNGAGDGDTVTADITTTLGKNNVWSDGGEVAVDYRADPTLFVDNKIAAVMAVISQL